MSDKKQEKIVFATGPERPVLRPLYGSVYHSKKIDCTEKGTTYKFFSEADGSDDITSWFKPPSLGIPIEMDMDKIIVSFPCNSEIAIDLAPNFGFKWMFGKSNAWIDTRVDELDYDPVNKNFVYTWKRSVYGNEIEEVLISDGVTTANLKYEKDDTWRKPSLYATNSRKIFSNERFGAEIICNNRHPSLIPEDLEIKVSMVGMIYYPL